METILIFNQIELTVLALAFLLLIIQIIYYTGLYNKINSHSKAVDKGKIVYNEELPPLSIIICAHDESYNLRRNLPAILEQDYPQFEVIVVNDGSTDESDDILKLLSNQYPHLYHTFTPESSRYISRKKISTTLGIKASKYPWLVFTEANCKPTSNQWLKQMARNFTPDTDIVLGYSNCKQTKGWMNRKTTFDLFFHSVRYLGYALCGKPFMGIGRNMAYRKELFFREKGFSNQLNLLRGEDNLFINQIANENNTRVETSVDSIIEIQTISRLKDWKEEKLNYYIASNYFKGKQHLWLGFETTTRLFLYLSCIGGMVLSILNHQWLMLAFCFIFLISRYIMQAIILNKTNKNLGGNLRFVAFLPLFDFLQPLQTLGFKLNLLFKGTKEFKRR